MRRKADVSSQGILGTFDSLNPYIIKGLAAQAARGSVIGGYVIESLMQRGYDEPFTLYGLLAHSVETDAARSYVTFNLNPAARFSDGKPVTPEDVLFSWQLLRDKGRPNHRLYYSKVSKAEAIGNNAVRFDLTGSDDRELPLILGLMSVLPKHAVNPDTFEETQLRADDRQRALCRDARSAPDKASPSSAIRTIGAAICRLTAGCGISTKSGSTTTAMPTHISRPSRRASMTCGVETNSTRWATGYDFPALREGRVTRETFTTGLPKPSFFFVFNTRRPIFEDIRVREAISLLYDFAWINKNLFFGLYAPARELLPRLGAFVPWPSGRCARTRAARAVSQRGAR